ncbi:helix-turn-helix domain-containing protein [Alistipes sp. OttesenSCG-928-B03]|nr:helix-turn-helix domain-containing protein [Alistipes sp. OttesenSCG-928-B03]
MKKENVIQEATPTLQMAVVPQDWLNEVREQLYSVKSILEEKSQDEINSQYIESAKAREMLGISQKTWQNYRDERRIPFIQFGRKIYVKRADLDAFMNEHYITYESRL